MSRLLLAAALLLAACNVDVDPQFRVKDVRLLAVRAGVPSGRAADVSAGDTLVLDALVANPLGRPGLAVDWFACLPGASDAVTPCEDLATLDQPSRLRGNPSVRFLGQGARVEYVVPALDAALEFQLGKARQQRTYECRLHADLLVVAVASAEGKSSLAVKTVPVLPTAAQIADFNTRTGADVTSHYALNLNPIAADVARAPSDPDACAGGTSPGAGPFPAGKTVLCGLPGPGSVDEIERCDPDRGPQRDLESLGWQWYVTDGDFPEAGGVGNARGDHVDFTRPPGAFTLWAILRDGRGGTDWVSYAVSTL